MAIHGWFQARAADLDRADLEVARVGQLGELHRRPRRRRTAPKYGLSDWWANTVAQVGVVPLAGVDVETVAAW